LSIPKLKLLVGLPVASATLACGAVFLIYARSKGWSMERTKHIGFWAIMTILYGGIGIGLALLWHLQS